MPTRNGKIANLPIDLREQLNLRLLEGETGRELAAWLNALPEAHSVLASQFNGSPVSEVNITLWRQGGYLQWLTERECFDSARSLAEGDCNLATTGLSAERLLNVLTVRFGQLLMRWDLPPDESVSEADAFAQMAKKARILQSISRSLLAIHRIQSQHSSPSHSLPECAPLAQAPIALTAPASKTPVPPRAPVTAENRAEPTANSASDPTPKSASMSSQPPVASSNRVPGLDNAISGQRRTLRGHPGVRPETSSEPLAPSVHPPAFPVSGPLRQAQGLELAETVRSPVSTKTDLHLSEFLAAV